MRSGLLSLFALTAVFFVVGCNGSKNKFTIIGELENMPQQQVLLEELNINEIKIIDSVQSTQDGKFELSGIAPEPGLYRISFPDHQYILLSIDKGNLKVKGKYDAVYNYSVAGSPSSSSLKNFLGSIREFSKDMYTISEVVRTMKRMGNDSMMQVAEADMKEANFQLTQFIEHYADTTQYLPNALFAVQILNPNAERPYLEAFSQGLGRRFPKTRMAREFNDKISKQFAPQQPTVREQVASQTPSNAASTAPDFTLNTPEGKPVALSSFRGKYVLVDFWASWCGPCRKENPNVVKAYEKYKNKNFTILGVSLDDDKDNWLAAIKADKLGWTQVSDLKGWESAAAQLYQIQSIPANFLLDTAGKIIASDLRGPQLEMVLQQVLK